MSELEEKGSSPQDCKVEKIGYSHFHPGKNYKKKGTTNFSTKIVFQ